MKKFNPAKIIDHTNIDLRATAQDIKKTCREAKKYKFRGICVNPEWTKLVSQELNPVRDHRGKKEARKKQISNGVKGTGIKTIVLIDPPMGLSSHFKRVELAKKVKKDGADELDVVMNIIDLKYERYDDVLDDLKEICKILPTKVIIGSGYLTDKEIEKASSLVKKAGAFCVKTATEKDPLERIELKEKARHLKIMAKAAPGLEIKASGKIMTYRDLLMMREAGADIIGSSSSVEIIKGYKRSKRK